LNNTDATGNDMKGAIALFDVGWTFYRHRGIIYSLLKLSRPQSPKLEPNAHERFKKTSPSPVDLLTVVWKGKTIALSGVKMRPAWD
jgi:hypothetical protein